MWSFNQEMNDIPIRSFLWAIMPKEPRKNFLKIETNFAASQKFGEFVFL
jgi:hypothetical protein